ncbi:MAG: hypothetical protein AB1638_00885 [Nitrospirota bacterium]
MDQFLQGLLIDLLSRCDVLRLLVSKESYHEDVREYIGEIIERLEKITIEAQQILKDPAFGALQLLQNHLQDYNRLVERLHFIESFPVPFVTRYNKTDQKITRFCKLLVKEINYPLPPPLIACFSNQYYWTKPDFNLICSSTLESDFLLGLPDLCHELGHILLYKYEDRLLTKFLEELKDYIRAEIQRVKREQKPNRYIEGYMHLFEQWKDRWVKEFISDMIATYITGPAFGWQHLRLCAGMTRNIYYPGFYEGAIHPSDESRMRGIFAMMRLLKIGNNKMEEKWNHYKSIAGNIEPQEYRLCYPDQLIESLAKYTYKACQEIQLKSYIQQSSTSVQKSSIVLILNNAWEYFLNVPEHYRDKEVILLNEIQMLLGDN